jgi:hypothetical protein
VTEALNTANNALNLLLVGIGLYLANNFRRQLHLKMADRRLEAYSRLWEVTKDSGA